MRQRALEHCRAVAGALPVRDALAEPNAPAFDVLGDGDGDVRKEPGELVVRDGGMRGRSPAWRGRPETIERTFAGVTGRSPNASCAASRLSAPCSSRTLPHGIRASSSSTPLANVISRSAHLLRRIATRVSYSGRPMSTIETTGEPRDQPLIDVGDLRRRPVARHDDLAAAALQRVEDAQHLALRLATAGEELHVIDQQQIDALVAAA